LELGVWSLEFGVWSEEFNINHLTFNCDRLFEARADRDRLSGIWLILSMLNWSNPRKTAFAFIPKSSASVEKCHGIILYFLL